MVLVAMTFLRPTPPMPADEEDDIYLPELWLETLQHWVTFLGPLLLVPTFSALLYTTASRIIRTRESFCYAPVSPESIQKGTETHLRT